MKTIVVIFLAGNTILLLLLWTNNRPRRIHEDNAKEYLTKELSLSNAQLSSYDRLRDEHVNVMRKLDSDLRDVRDKMFDHLPNGTLDSNEVGSLLQKIGDNEKARDSLTFYHFRKLRAELNNEQQQKFDKVIKNALRMMAPRREPKMRDRPEGAGPPPIGEPAAESER